MIKIKPQNTRVWSSLTPTLLLVLILPVAILLCVVLFTLSSPSSAQTIDNVSATTNPLVNLGNLVLIVIGVSVIICILGLIISIVNGGSNSSSPNQPTSSQQPYYGPVSKQTVSPNPVWSTQNPNNQTPTYVPQNNPIQQITINNSNPCPICGSPIKIYSQPSGGYVCPICMAKVGTQTATQVPIYSAKTYKQPASGVIPSPKRKTRSSKSSGSYSLYINGQVISLSLGNRIKATDIPGTQPLSGSDSIAEVITDSTNDLTLKNISANNWLVFESSGNTTIATGGNIKIHSGIRIKFGIYVGEIRED